MIYALFLAGTKALALSLTGMALCVEPAASDWIISLCRLELQGDVTLGRRHAVPLAVCEGGKGGQSRREYSWLPDHDVRKMAVQSAEHPTEVPDQPWTHDPSQLT